MFRNIAVLEKALSALPAAMKPSQVNGKWRAPELSRRKIAELRRGVLALKRDWVWDVPRKQVKERPPKGHKHDREKPERQAKIAAALAKQPEIIAAHRERRRVKDTASPFELFSLTHKELLLRQRSSPKNPRS